MKLPLDLVNKITKFLEDRADVNYHGTGPNKAMVLAEDWEKETDDVHPWRLDDVYDFLIDAGPEGCELATEIEQAHPDRYPAA
jgi:hypothetical protein